jgi:hypothetical protein
MAIIRGKGKGRSKGGSSKGGSSKGRRDSKGGRDSKGKGKGGGNWVFVPKGASLEVDRRDRRGKGSSKGKGGRHDRDGGRHDRDDRGGKGKGRKGKGGGKGKGRRFAASLTSKFWEKKEEEENRQSVGDDIFTGIITRYSSKFGWGFILPDDPDSLPQKVKNKLKNATAAAKKDGKEVKEPNALYFRKPDVNHSEDFKLGGKDEDTPCTFKVYVDSKGAGAFDVSQA